MVVGAAGMGGGCCGGLIGGLVRGWSFSLHQYSLNPQF